MPFGNNYPPGVTGAEDIFWEDGEYDQCSCGSDENYVRCSLWECDNHACKDCGVMGEYNEIFCSEECKTEQYKEV